MYPGAQTTSFLGHFETMDMTSPRASSSADCRGTKPKITRAGRIFPHWLNFGRWDQDFKSRDTLTRDKTFAKKDYTKMKTDFSKVFKNSFKERKFRDWKKKVCVGLCIKMSLTWQMGWEWGEMNLWQNHSKGHLQMATRNWEIIHWNRTT